MPRKLNRFLDQIYLVPSILHIGSMGILPIGQIHISFIDRMEDFDLDVMIINKSLIVLCVIENVSNVNFHIFVF